MGILNQIRIALSCLTCITILLTTGCSSNTTSPVPGQAPSAKKSDDQNRGAAVAVNNKLPMPEQVFPSKPLANAKSTKTAKAPPEPSDENEVLFNKVMKRLLSADVVVDEYPTKYSWPPKYFIKPDSANETNAYASAHKLHGAIKDEKSGKIRPVVMVTEGFLKSIVNGDENVLAAVMGHELAHLIKDHVGGRKGETALLMLAFGRQAEIEADLEGMRFAVASGYPYKASIRAAVRIMKEVPGYSSFEGLHTSHPSWEERLVFLDRSRAKIWKSMAAFRNGYLFLELDQFVSAEQCFDAVVREFPDCSEAWANLGYAKLMRYIDLMEPDDLREFDTGQIVAGSFYSRAKSLEGKIRKIDVQLWRDAVAALEKALRLDENLAFARANLGVTHLLTPDGADADAAGKLFQEALARVGKDGRLKDNPTGMVSLLINAGVAELARNDTKKAQNLFRTASVYIKVLKYTPVAYSMRLAMLYNSALLEEKLEKPNKERAFELYEAYLADSSQDSAWRPLARKRYVKLGKELGRKVQSEKEIAKISLPTEYRPITSIKIKSGVLTLSEPIREAAERLGKKSGVATPLFPGSAIVRWRFAEAGIDMLGNEKLLAIFLKGAKAPPVIVQAIGLSTKPTELRIGMSEKEFDTLLKDQDADHLQRYVADAKVGYRFYRAIGLAVRFEKARVVELAVARIPYFSLQPKKE